MNPFSDQTSAQVAEEAETERAGLVNTLDQLRQNLRPENMVDEMFTQAQAGSSNLMDKVWTVARSNPVPAALIGIGAAMLVSAGQRIKKWPETTSHAWRTSAEDMVDHPATRQGWISASPIPDTQGLSEYTARPKGALSRLFDDQPLILAALGVAVGAAVGSAIRSTTVEAQWMGDASESVRRNAGAMAREQMSQLRNTAGETLDQLKATAAGHGLSAENMSGLVHDLGDDVRNATATVGHRAGATTGR